MFKFKWIEWNLYLRTIYTWIHFDSYSLYNLHEKHFESSSFPYLTFGLLLFVVWKVFFPCWWKVIYRNKSLSLKMFAVVSKRFDHVNYFSPGTNTCSVCIKQIFTTSSIKTVTQFYLQKVSVVYQDYSVVARVLPIDWHKFNGPYNFNVRMNSKVFHFPKMNHFVWESKFAWFFCCCCW